MGWGLVLDRRVVLVACLVAPGMGPPDEGHCRTRRRPRTLPPHLPQVDLKDKWRNLLRHDPSLARFHKKYLGRADRPHHDDPFRTPPS